MRHPDIAWSRLVLLLVLAAAAPLARAQHFLVALDANGKPQLVRAAVETSGLKTDMTAGRLSANVEIADKSGALQVVEEPNLAFLPAPIWGSGLIDVSHLNVEIVAGSSLIRAYGTIKSDTALPNCVLVLIAKSPAVGGGPPDREIKFFPVPESSGTQIMMPAGTEVLYDHSWPLLPQFDDVNGTWELHFFSNGVEFPTTLTTPAEIAAGRAKTEAYLLRNHPDSGISLIKGVKPVYPDELKAKNLAGSATLRCRVDRDGNVASADVVSATDPAFGKAAVEAVRQWKFSPAVKAHHYVEQTVEFPVNFSAPNP